MFRVRASEFSVEGGGFPITRILVCWCSFFFGGGGGGPIMRCIVYWGSSSFMETAACKNGNPFLG